MYWRWRTLLAARLKWSFIWNRVCSKMNRSGCAKILKRNTCVHPIHLRFSASMFLVFLNKVVRHGKCRHEYYFRFSALLQIDIKPKIKLNWTEAMNRQENISQCVIHHERILWITVGAIDTMKRDKVHQPHEPFHYLLVYIYRMYTPAHILFVSPLNILTIPIICL